MTNREDKNSIHFDMKQIITQKKTLNYLKKHCSNNFMFSLCLDLKIVETIHKKITMKIKKAVKFD